MKPTRSAIPRKWSWHHDALMRLRDTLLRERDEHTAASREMREHGGTDAMDWANDEAEHQTLVAELAQEEAELAEVEAALRRIEQGTYGFCEATGEPIAPQRLRAVPWTRLSQQAAEQREEQKRLQQ